MNDCKFRYFVFCCVVLCCVVLCCVLFCSVLFCCVVRFVLVMTDEWVAVEGFRATGS